MLFRDWVASPLPSLPSAPSQESRLTGMPRQCIFMCMKRTLNIDDTLLRRALTGVTRRTSLVRLALQTLIAREIARPLAELGGTGKSLLPIRRRPPRKAASLPVVTTTEN